MTTAELTFDKLVYIDRLTSAGVVESQARAHAEALDQALRDTIATKSDIVAVKSDIAAAKQELREEIRVFRDEMREGMRAFRNEMREDMRAFREETREDMRVFRDEMRNEIVRLDHKIDVLGRDLTIRMGGIAIILFGALASIKFFG